MKITLQTKSGQFEYDCAPGETILSAGLRHGITLPYECATGTCGTCRCRVMQGDALMGWQEAPGAARLKREKGDCLMCQTVVSSDALIRVASQNVLGAFPRGHVPAHCNGAIANCRKLTHDVMQFDVMIDQPMSFDAGQFVTLAVAGVTGPRAYSMVNFQQATDRLTFVVKRSAGGAFSDWLFDTDVAGATLKVFGPLGAATFYPDEAKNIICIGGGSGIAGMMSIIERACQENYFNDHKGHVFFGVRTLKDCFYMAELSEYVTCAGPNLSVTVALSDEDTGLATHPDFDNLKLDTGFVHEAASRAMTGKFDNMVGYVAGPPPMVDAALRVLIAEGKLPPADIRYDKFS
ncbi:MAG: 2Fe-2S iron-sulfur cluster binding domain-containing protein [Rhizobiales bacterium]|nr:2Fe-2S iron-sulfur cluster binding domain-containing protein [Hyphomicrobiales bacterium]